MHESFEIVRGRFDDSDAGRAKRATLYALACMGFDVSRGRCALSNDVLVRTYASDADRWAAWCAESLYCCAYYLSTHEPKVALRCLLQANEYCGRFGGWPWQLGDTFRAMQNAVEALLVK